ncbi:effector-associated domain EAD1-containing protein [Streptomyces griseus]|uniref:effector-associated domain EAD1-containing protein n=1 Tax=Streptomyces griseus TaxID=1911 RepID=UPI00056872C6|nr:effector-associated domain EAD1-containing protein [Streptomyces griseus]
MRDDLRDALYRELEETVTPEEAGMYLASLRFPMHRLDFRTAPQLFWSKLRKLLDRGVLVDGEDSLIRQIAPAYPGNPVLQQAYWSLSAPQANHFGGGHMPAQPPPPPPHPGYPQYGAPPMPPQYQAQTPEAPPQGYFAAPLPPDPTTAAPGMGFPPGRGTPPFTGPYHAQQPQQPHPGRPHPQETIQTPTTPPDPEPAAPTEFHTLVFIAVSHHGDFIMAVQEEDLSAQVLFVSSGAGAPVGQVAMLLSEPLPPERVTALRNTLRDRGASDLEILQQVHGHRPHIFRKLHALGPDQQPYEFDNVPSTTTGHDIAAAVLGFGEGALRERLARRRRTVVDRSVPGGDWVELDPLSQTLYDSGVRDGDTLRVSPESTAGAGAPQSRIRAILRVKREILRYAQQHGDSFRIDHMDDSEFPTVYDISFDALGFRPPPEGAPPGTLPMPQPSHTVTILLGPDFPYGAPVAVWQTPVFHPNILGPERPPGFPPGAPDGLVCLGPLNRAYRPTMDFGRLCQMLVDIAGYRTYDVRSHNDGGEGWFNARAAAWAASEKGEGMIKDIGGVPSAPARENPDGDAGSLRVRALRLRKADVVGDGA